MAQARRLTAVSATQREPVADLRDSVRTTIAAMDWLTPTDDALADLAARLAVEIETAVDRAQELDRVMREAGGRDDYKRLQRLEAFCDVTKSVALLGPQLQAVLRDLGGTPAARAAMKKDKPVGSRLAQLRDAATGGVNNP